MIISVSKRTDIPSFYGEWFINRLKEGYVIVNNPYDNNRYYEVDLTIDAVDIIVFWTKNPIPFLKHLVTIDEMGYKYYFQYTITPYGKEMETALPSKEKLISAFIEISKKIGKDRMVWRYDPIIINDIYTIDYHTEKFDKMAKELARFASKCIISFVDSYKNVMNKNGNDIGYQTNNDNIYKLAESFRKISQKYQLTIVTCAEEIDLCNFDIIHGACIDKKMIEGILNANIESTMDKYSRNSCNCIESIDIGTYNSCANGCKYCYAIKDSNKALENLKNHNKYDPVLFGEIAKDAIITKRKNNSIVDTMIKLF